MRGLIFARVFFSSKLQKNFRLPSSNQGVLDKIFWIYHVREQDLDFGLEKFTPNMTLTQCNFSLRKFRGYVNLAILNSQIDKLRFSIWHLVREKY